MIAPKIILDKSTLRGIKTSQISTLFRHLDALIPPILLREIITELSKEKEDPVKLEEMASSLARKVCSSRADMLPNIDILIGNELLGQPLELSSKQLPQGHGLWVRGKNGSRGIFFDEAPEMSIFRRWAAEDFSDVDILDAFQIRAAHEQMILNTSQEKKWEKSNLASVIEHVDRNCLKNQEQIISTLAAYLSDSQSEEMNQRWRDMGKPGLLSYAPFSYYFYRLTAIYILGCHTKCIGTRKDAKSHLDVEYLYYLPFCDIFATGDNELYEIAQLLKRPDQIVLKTDVLRSEIEILATQNTSKVPRIKVISRRPLKECPAFFIHKAWETFAGPERNESTNFQDSPKTSPDMEVMKEFGICRSSVIAESNKSLDPVYTQQFDKLSLRQKNLILCDEAMRSCGDEQSDILRFFNLYGDLWRPDSDLKVLLKDCPPYAPLWMFDGNKASYLEFQLMIPYFNQILTIDPVTNPWNIRHNLNPLTQPDKYLCFFREVRMFYGLANEALGSRQLLILPHIEEFIPKLAWDFAEREQKRQGSKIVTDEEKVELAAMQERFMANIRITKLQRPKEDNGFFWGVVLPRLEGTILLSNLTSSIPITSSVIKKNEFLQFFDQEIDCEYCLEIQNILQNYWFRFIPEYSPFLMSKLKESGFLLSFRKFFPQLLSRIKEGGKIEKKWGSDLRFQLTLIDQEWDALFSSGTFDPETIVQKGKLSIYIGAEGKFRLNEFSPSLNELYKDHLKLSDRTVFMTISDIAKSE